MATAYTESIKGTQVEVRMGGFTWRATVSHLGGGGTTYEKYDGGWKFKFFDSVPTSVYRALRRKVREAVGLDPWSPTDASAI